MIYMFLAEGFEEIEALCPLDLLRRVNLDITTVGVGNKFITGAHGITVKADIVDTELSYSSLDMIFLPGGMPGTLNLAASDTVINAIKDAYRADAYIAAICAAPSILGDMGLLKGKKAVCYPGFEERLIGAEIPEQNVVLDGKILTAKGMGVALEMGLEIVKIFCGEETAKKLSHAVISN
ncbi:MAG: DJ-1/PfpI family protein [Clostridia bacterium]|nr:DJ-1/PfpI family protein [Clostridia bacterium]